MEFLSWQNLWHERLARQAITPAEKLEQMRAANPAVIPRNHKVEEALAAATEHGDPGIVEKLLNALANPFDETEENAPYRTPAPATDAAYRTFCGT